MHQVFEAFSLASEQIVDRNAHVIKEQLGGILRVQTDLLQVAAALVALHPALDHQQADAVMNTCWIGFGYYD